MHYAISFCHEHDDSDLWDDLINHCIDKPGRIFILLLIFVLNYLFIFFIEFITFLLQSIGSFIDPTVLILKIKKDMKIPGLKNSLVKMLNQYNLQVMIIIIIINRKKLRIIFRFPFKKDAKKF